MVLVGVAEHDDVDPSIPRREVLIEGDEESPRIRPAVDEQPAAALALEQDGVALPDVEDRQPGGAVGAMDDGDGERDDRHRQPAGEGALGPASWASPQRPGRARPCEVPVAGATDGAGDRRCARSGSRRAGRAPGAGDRRAGSGPRPRPRRPRPRARSRSRLANGTAAPARTSPTMAARRVQAGRPPTAATSVGAPAAERPPATSATAPAAMAGATSGTTPRLITGETIDRRPNSRATIGSVASCAASETPRDSASQARSRPGAGPARRAVSGVPQAMSPAVASAERRKPDVVDEPGIDEQEDRDGPADRRRRPARPAELAGQQDDARPSPPPGRPRATRRRRPRRRRSRPR